MRTYRRARIVMDRCGALRGGGLEALEPRCLLAFAWTPEEVYLTELVNRARANPQAEASRLGIDLTAGLSAGEIARLVPSEPLALNEYLTVAARLHSQDMADRDFFDHVNPDGLNPTQRAQAAGYAGTAGENIAAGYTAIDDVHKAWLESVGHRKNVLSLHANFTSTFHYDEFGPGFAFTEIAPFFDYYSQEFGVQNGTPDLFVLGVVFGDANSDGFYGIGEGMANVRVDVARTTEPGSPIATYTTDPAGNYQLAVGPGSYIVTFTNQATGLLVQRPLTMSNVNVRLTAMASEMVESPGGSTTPDDHANADNLAGATVVFIDPASGDGVSAGALTPGSDTDLFRFTVAAAGTLTITLTTPEAGLAPAIWVLGATGNHLGIGDPINDGTDALFEFSVVQGQTYFVQVQSADGASEGNYVLTINGPGQTGGGGGGGPGDGTTPPPSEALVADPAEGISASANAGGRLTLLTTSSQGRPVVFQLNGSAGWTAMDLMTYAGGLADAQSPKTWTDPKDGRTYVAARSASGLLLFTNADDGTWSYRNLTAEILGAQVIASTLTVYTTTDGMVNIAGQTQSGDVVVYAQNGASGPSGYVWTFYNITTRDLVPQGLATPQFAGELISYVTSWNGLTIAGLDADGNIQAVWWAPGQPRWSTQNLTAATSASELTGGLTVYLTPWGGINVGGIDREGKVSIAWWLPNAPWRLANLTDDAGGPFLEPGSTMSFVTSWGALNVVGVDLTGRLVAYWWSPDVIRQFREDKWQVTVLSDQVTGTRPVPSSAMIGVATSDTINVVGVTNAGSVCRYWWQAGGQWQAENISDIATAI